MARFWILAFSVLGAVLAGCAGPAPDHSRSAEGAPERLLIISATGAEFEAVARRVENPVVNEIGPSVAVEGRVGAVHVVALHSGVSIVNAAMTTQWALDTYPVRAIIVSGTAAGLDPDLGIGDVVIAEQWGKYNEMFFLREADGPPPTMSPLGRPLTFAPFDFMAPREARPLPSASGASEEQFWFPIDQELSDLARRTASDIILAPCFADEICVDRTPEVRFAEAGVSGSVFMDNIAFGTYLRETFGASILEMETAAIAIVARANGVPFIAVRSISDRVQPAPPGDHEYINYHPLAAENAARVAVGLVVAIDP
ncbi:MAG: 5'-methylthioadenosine/S-adenosylhomocysteine nucleosidase [Alphaproteobacteria bacterium]